MRQMGRVAESTSALGGEDRILLVGDVGKAFLDGDRADRYACDIRASALEAIEMATKHCYPTVGVVLDGLAGQLRSVLKALRHGTPARIILLAQMYEEPIARCLTSETADEEKAADGYWVCPTTLASFCRGVRAGAGQEQAVQETAAVDGTYAAMEVKIRQLERLATTDDLTGLKNRRYIWEFARQVLQRGQQSGGRVTLLVFDIDNFKHYNDVYGHPTGDEILRQAALLMQRCCRPHDVVGRIGGDEFAVVFWEDPCCQALEGRPERRSTEAEHPSEAIFIAKRFQNEFGNSELHLLGPEGHGILTISGGLASFPRDGVTIQELFERADGALLDAKRSGKNRIYLVGEPRNNIADIS